MKDWNTDHAKTDTEITKIYHNEIDGLIRNELYPSAEYGDILKIDQMNAVLTRGKGQSVPFYGAGIHQDYG